MNRFKLKLVIVSIYSSCNWIRGKKNGKKNHDLIVRTSWVQCTVQEKLHDEQSFHDYYQTANNQREICGIKRDTRKHFARLSNATHCNVQLNRIRLYVNSIFLDLTVVSLNTECIFNCLSFLYELCIRKPNAISPAVFSLHLQA